MKLNLIKDVGVLYFHTILLQKVKCICTVNLPGIVTIFVNLIADVSYAFMSSYFFQTSSIKTKKLINTISGICLVLIGIYLF